LESQDLKVLLVHKGLRVKQAVMGLRELLVLLESQDLKGLKVKQAVMGLRELLVLLESLDLKVKQEVTGLRV
jgi:hypothetical protein